MSGVGISISDDLIMPILEAKVQAAIVEQLGGQGALIEKVVAEALNQKVEAERYSSKKIPWIQQVCQNVIREAAEKAIREWADGQKEQIAKEFLKQLKTQKTASQVVNSMITGMADVASCKWKFSVNLPE
jgi:hypothetical protein